MKDFSSVSNLLKEHLQRTEDPPADAAIQRNLLQLWDRCAGRAGDFSYPILFTSGRLVVFTESSVWATELHHLRGQIEQGLESLEITGFDIRTSPRVFLPEVSKARTVALSERNGLALESGAKKLNHSGLRDALIKLARHRNNENRD